MSHVPPTNTHPCLICPNTLDWGTDTCHLWKPRRRFHYKTMGGSGGRGWKEVSGSTHTSIHNYDKHVMWRPTFRHSNNNSQALTSSTQLLLPQHPELGLVFSLFYFIFYAGYARKPRVYKDLKWLKWVKLNWAQNKTLKILW